MKNKSVMGLIAVLVILVGISGCVTNSQNNTTTVNQTVQQNTTDNVTYNSSGANVSAEEAKNVAKRYIEPGATAGEPTLINTDGKSTYMVPVILKGNQVGQIIIDAQTGEFIAGAGGVSTDTK